MQNRCKNFGQYTSKLNVVMFLKNYTNAKWDLFQECKSGQTYKNQYNEPH